MLKIRYVLMVLGVMLCSVASSATQVSIQIGIPNVSIGVNVPVYPQLVVVPGYPVYYAPQLNANYFFYDGMYWVYQDDSWYASNWYNGPWGLVNQDIVPVFVLRIPVRYYRQPPVYFRGWRSDAPPHWGDHWGRDWESRRSGWNKWNHGAPPAAAPLPQYQRQYSRDHYPRQVEQQQEIHKQNYRYQPHDPIVREHYLEQSKQRAPVQHGNQEAPAHAQQQQRGGNDDQRPHSASPQQHRPPGQENRHSSQPVQDQREQQMPSSQGREERQQGKDATREPKRGQRQEQGRDRND